MMILPDIFKISEFQKEAISTPGVVDPKKLFSL